MILFALLFFLKVFGNDLLIHTSFGDIQGTYTKFTRAFFNIPFSPKPVRFEPSTPWTTLFHTSPYDATFPGNCCFQPPSIILPPLPQSEDCLNLNVFLPKSPFSEKLPVMVWIHGGAFMSGSGGDPMFTQSDFAENQNMILVTINYRLGVFGQFAYEKDDQTTSGLAFLSDQMNALKWVNSHITNFGGDVDNISIFGESAGGISVCMLLASPEIQKMKLFKRAILMSGPCTGPWGPITKNEGLVTSKIFQDSFNVDINGLRQIPPDQLLQSKLYLGVRPAIDDLFLTKDPLEHFKDGLDVDSLMLGSVFADGTAWQAFIIRDYTNLTFHYPTTWQEFELQMLKWFPSSATHIANLYKTILPNATEAFYKVNSDLCVNCPTQKLVLETRAHTPSFLYSYNFGGKMDSMAPHASDIILLFKTWRENPAVLWTTERYNLFNDSLANDWQRYLSNFGYSGKPSGDWSPVDGSGNDLQTFEFSVTSQMENDLRVRCKELDQLVNPSQANEFCWTMGT